MDCRQAPAQSAPADALACDPGGGCQSRVTGAISRAAQHGKLWKADAMRTAVDVLRGTDGVVHVHPYRAIGIAAGLALLVGFFAARR
jgi:ElaB/YqjD/DUF883 family membrane-anchored ribosome-binding protein